MNNFTRVLNVNGVVDLSKIAIKRKKDRENIEQYHASEEMNDLNSIIVITTRPFPARKQYDSSLNLRKDELNIKLVEELMNSYQLYGTLF
jgi:hypothetical protein